MQSNIHSEVYRLEGFGWKPDSGWETRLDGSTRALEVAQSGETAMLVIGQEMVVASPAVFWQPFEDWLEKHKGERA